LNKVFVHQSAEVDKSAKIGSGSKIWHQVQILEEAIIGQNCNLGKSVYIDKGVRLGNKVKVQNGVSVYRGVTIEDECFIGPNATFTNDMYPRATNDDFLITDTLVKKGASIGANATIICGVVIGEYSMIGAGAVVTKDVPPFTLVVGNPAKEISKICFCGFKLDEINTCEKCGYIK